MSLKSKITIYRLSDLQENLLKGSIARTSIELAIESTKERSLFLHRILLKIKQQKEELSIAEELEAKSLEFRLRYQINRAKADDLSTPLRRALEEEDFLTARILLDNGAVIDEKTRDLLDIVIQSESKLVRKYRSTFSIDKKPVIQPKMKKYGLMLGIEAYSSKGVYSQYSLMGAPFAELTNKIRDYVTAGPVLDIDRNNIAEIARAYILSNDMCKYHGSIPSVEAALGLAHAARSACKHGGVVTIPSGFAGHAIGVSIVDDYLVVTNRGIGRDPLASTKIYKISSQDKIDADFINTLIFGMGVAKRQSVVYSRLLSITDGHPVATFNQEKQKHNNCTFINPESNVAGILLVQNARKLGGLNKLSPKGIGRLVDKSLSSYRRMSSYIRDAGVRELMTDLRANPGDEDLKILAVSYIEQYNEQADACAYPLMQELYFSLPIEYRESLSLKIREGFLQDNRDCNNYGKKLKQLEHSFGRGFDSGDVLIKRETYTLKRDGGRLPDYLESEQESDPIITNKARLLTH